MRNLLFALVVTAVPGAALAGQTTVPLPAQVCSPPTSSDVNCLSSMLVDMRAATKVRLSFQGQMLPTQSSNAKSTVVILQQFSPTSGWRCVGNPCAGIRLTEGPPGHGGVQVRGTGDIAVPAGQRLAATRLRLAVKSTQATDPITVVQPALVTLID